MLLVPGAAKLEPDIRHSILELVVDKEREARRAADEHALSKAMLEKPSGEKPSHEDKPAGGDGNGHSTQPAGSDAQQRLDIKA